MVRVKSLRGFRAVIMGPPGCGKGFVSHRMVEQYKCNHISTGDILRKHITRGTDCGRCVEQYLSRGEMVPDELLESIVNEALRRKNYDNFILDGYPRNLPQAINLDEQTNLDFVINVHLPPLSILERVLSRRVHLPSGRVYSHGDMAPCVPGRDDVTGERLVRREDDRPEVWVRRMKSYEQHMNPVIDYYRAQNLLVTFHVNEHESLWPAVKKYLTSNWGGEEVE